MRKALPALRLLLFALALIGLTQMATRGKAQSGSRTARPAYHDRLWIWLQRNDYRTWSGPDGKRPDFAPGQSPHGALIKTYVSPTAARDVEDLADGSVIVKENFDQNKKLMAITIMQRSRRYDPDHGDWYYAKYMPGGKIATMGPEGKSMPVAGRLKMCIDCHSGADGDDYVFFND